MNYYLFGERTAPLFPEDQSSFGDIDVAHYSFMLDYLSTSEFVLEEHRQYFKKELLVQGRTARKSREDLPKALEARRQAQQERYATCLPGTPSRWMPYARILVTLLNGTHGHEFLRPFVGGLTCRKCGSRFSDTHDLGEAQDLGEAYTGNSCRRCGAVPTPFWVSRGKRRLSRWYGAGVRSLTWSWTQVRKEVPWSLLMLLLGGVVSNRITSWWPF